VDVEDVISVRKIGNIQRNRSGLSRRPAHRRSQTVVQPDAEYRIGDDRRRGGSAGYRTRIYIKRFILLCSCFNFSQ
jgi:hypothetical protein